MDVMVYLATAFITGVTGWDSNGIAPAVLIVATALFLGAAILAALRRDNDRPHGSAKAYRVPDRLDSEPRGGAVSRIRPTPGSHSSTPVTTGASSRRTVLVVDDNATVIRFVERALNDTYAVRSANNGREALTAAAEARPDLIISDVMMPEMDGHELCRKVKGDPELRHIPIVLLTSLATENDLIQGLELGSDDYIFKPFNTRELRARVGNLISAREEQRRLAIENSRLNSANDSKTQLLSHAAHDLKNPLTAIRELAEIVKEEVGPGSEAYKPAELIHRSSNQMLHIITSLLESEALEEGHIPMNPQPVDLAAIAMDVIHRNDALARRKGQTIELTTTGGDCTAEVDEHLLFEAMDNLVNNAVKYSPLGGAIRVAVVREEDRIRFAVSDHGPGLSEEEQTLLFQKFERLSPQPTGGESSTGLGLAIVKQIVELHGGAVKVRSAPGEGSTFALEVPSYA